MEYYELEMKGKFILEKLYYLPTFVEERDKGRLVYITSNNRCYFGTSSDWKIMNPDYPILNDHENRITQNEDDIDSITSELNDHIGSRDEHPTVTTTEDGFMSDDGKTKLDNINYDANNYSLEVHGNEAHSENYLKVNNINVSLNDFFDVDLSVAPVSGDVLSYNGSDWSADSPKLHHEYRRDRCKLYNLIPYRSYLIIAEFTARNKGTGGATLVRPRLVNSSGSTVAYGTYRNVGINWPDGNFPRTSIFHLNSAPSDGYVRLAGSVHAEFSIYAINIG